MNFIVKAMKTKKKIKLLEAMLIENEQIRRAIVRNTHDPLNYITTFLNSMNRVKIQSLLSKLKSEQR